MTEETGFIAALAANPSDRLVPLVYADWLDDRDDPRGKVLRTWVELAWFASHAGAGFRGVLAEYRRLLRAADPAWRRAIGVVRPWVDARLAEEICRGCLRYVERRPPGQRGVIAESTSWASDPFPPGWLIRYWVPYHTTGPHPQEWCKGYMFVQPELGWVYGVTPRGPQFLKLDIEAGEGCHF